MDEAVEHSEQEYISSQQSLPSLMEVVELLEERFETYCQESRFDFYNI